MPIKSIFLGSCCAYLGRFSLQPEVTFSVHNRKCYILVDGIVSVYNRKSYILFTPHNGLKNACFDVLSLTRWRQNAFEEKNCTSGSRCSGSALQTKCDINFERSFTPAIITIYSRRIHHFSLYAGGFLFKVGESTSLWANWLIFSLTFYGHLKTALVIRHYNNQLCVPMLLKEEVCENPGCVEIGDE